MFDESYGALAFYLSWGIFFLIVACVSRRLKRKRSKEKSSIVSDPPVSEVTQTSQNLQKDHSHTPIIIDNSTEESIAEPLTVSLKDAGKVRHVRSRRSFWRCEEIEIGGIVKSRIFKISRTGKEKSPPRILNGDIEMAVNAVINC